jgi:hypothetical protein
MVNGYFITTIMIGDWKAVKKLIISTVCMYDHINAVPTSRNYPCLTND